MSEEKELSKKLKSDWAKLESRVIMSTVVVIILVIIIVGVISNTAQIGKCDNCGYETKLRKYKNGIDTYMYCENCYEFISYFDF